MSKFEDLFDETKLLRYSPPPPWLMRESSGGGTHKRTTKSRRREYEGCEVWMEGTKSGSFSVRVYDTSYGSRKLVGRTSGMPEWEAEDLYEEICDKLRGGLGE